MVSDQYNCMAWLDRYEPSPMFTRVETVELQGCAGCVVMVKIWGGMEGAGVRANTGGVSKVLGWWPMMVKMEGESRV